MGKEIQFGWKIYTPEPNHFLYGKPLSRYEFDNYILDIEGIDNITSN